VDVSSCGGRHEVGQRRDHVERHVGDVLRMLSAHRRRTGDHHVRVTDRLHLSITPAIFPRSDKLPRNLFIHSLTYYVLTYLFIDWSAAYFVYIV